MGNDNSCIKGSGTSCEISSSSIENDTVTPIFKAVTNGEDINKICVSHRYYSHKSNLADHVIFENIYPNILKYLLDNKIDLSKIDKDAMLQNIAAKYPVNIIEKLQERGYVFTAKHVCYACQYDHYLYEEGEKKILYLIENIDVSDSEIIINIMSNTRSTERQRIMFIEAAIKRGYKLTADDKQLIAIYPTINTIILSFIEQSEAGIN